MSDALIKSFGNSIAVGIESIHLTDPLLSSNSGFRSAFLF